MDVLIVKADCSRQIIDFRLKKSGSFSTFYTIFATRS
jgi:hypothetical protein